MAHTYNARFSPGLLPPLPIPHATLDSLPHSGSSDTAESRTGRRGTSHE